MGQQQLLLIVLGVIIVGISIVAAINVFSNQSYASNIDAMTADIIQFGSIAQQYYAKPQGFDGGGQSFEGFDASKILPDTSGTSFNNDNGSYTLDIASQQIIITGTGNIIKDNKYSKVEGIFTPTEITKISISSGLGEIR